MRGGVQAWKKLEEKLESLKVWDTSIMKLTERLYNLLENFEVAIVLERNKIKVKL